MRLDRAVQLNLLQRLANCYPEVLDDVQLAKLQEDTGFIPNLHYLIEHGLVEGTIKTFQSGEWYVHSVKASAQGMDFLADDGGLSAILGVVTIKLHDETIKSLIEMRILASDLPQPEKKRFLDQLRDLPAETTKHLVLKLVDLGLDKGQAAITAIGDILSRSAS